MHLKWPYTLVLLTLWLTSCDEVQYTVVTGSVVEANSQKILTSYPVRLRITKYHLLAGHGFSYKNIVSGSDGRYEFAFDSEKMTDYGIEPDTGTGYIGFWGFNVIEGRKNIKNLEVVPAARLYVQLTNKKKELSDSWRMSGRIKKSIPYEFGDGYATRKTEIYTSYDRSSNAAEYSPWVARKFAYLLEFTIQGINSNKDSIFTIEYTVQDKDTCMIAIDY